MPLYKEVAQMLFDQHKEGETNPGNYSMHLQIARNREKWHHFFNATIIWKTKENSREPFLIRCCGSRKRASKKKPYLGPVRHGRASGTDKSKKKNWKTLEERGSNCIFLSIKDKI